MAREGAGQGWEVAGCGVSCTRSSATWYLQQRHMGHPPTHPDSHTLPPYPSSHPPVHPFFRGKTNFFERRVGEYQRAGVMNSVSQSSLGATRKYEHTFTLHDDF